MSSGIGVLVEAILWSNLRVGLLLFLVVAAMSVFGAVSGAVRHRVWLAAIAGCLALPLLSFILPPLNVPILPPVDPLPELAIAPEPIVDAAPTGVSGARTAAGGISLMLVAAYAIGVLSTFGYFLVAFWRLVRLERQMSKWTGAEALELVDSICLDLAGDRPVTLLKSRSVSSPFTWGVLRPRVVLPAAAAGWSSDRLRNALLHELSHVRRCDWLFLCLERFAASVYWVNPLVWTAVRRSRYEAERACDDCVLRYGGRPADYAEQLVELMSSSRATHNLGIALGDGDFAGRVRSILNPSEEAPLMTILKTSLLTATTVCLVVVLGACQATTGQVVDQSATQQPDDFASSGALEQAKAETDPEQERARPELAIRVENAELTSEVERLEVQLAELAAARERLESERAGNAAAGSEAEFLAERMIDVEQRLMQSRRTRLEIEELSAATANVAAAERRRQSVARLAEALEARTVALSETRAQLARQEQTIRDLQVSLDRRTAQLSEMENELGELEAELAEARGD